MVIKNIERKTNEVIENGGKVKSDKKAAKKRTIFSLPLPLEVNEKIDECVQNRWGLSKTAWILEAIQEKIKRDKEE